MGAEACLPSALAESFSDPEFHTGTTHKATNLVPGGDKEGVFTGRQKTLTQKTALYACPLMCARPARERWRGAGAARSRSRNSEGLTATWAELRRGSRAHRPTQKQCRSHFTAFSRNAWRAFHCSRPAQVERKEKPSSAPNPLPHSLAHSPGLCQQKTLSMKCTAPRRLVLFNLIWLRVLV